MDSSFKVGPYLDLRYLPHQLSVKDVSILRIDHLSETVTHVCGYE
jgi:hypothetical protein